MHSSNFFTLNNWGVAKQTPLKARAFSNGTAFQGWGASLLLYCLLLIWINNSTHSPTLAFVFFPLSLVSPCLLFSLCKPHSVLQLVAFIFFSFSPQPHLAICEYPLLWRKLPEFTWTSRTLFLKGSWCTWPSSAAAVCRAGCSCGCDLPSCSEGETTQTVLWLGPHVIHIFTHLRLYIVF